MDIKAAEAEKKRLINEKMAKARAARKSRESEKPITKISIEEPITLPSDDEIDLMDESTDLDNSEEDFPKIKKRKKSSLDVVAYKSDKQKKKKQKITDVVPSKSSFYIPSFSNDTYSKYTIVLLFLGPIAAFASYVINVANATHPSLIINKERSKILPEFNSENSVPPVVEVDNPSTYPVKKYLSFIR